MCDGSIHTGRAGSPFRKGSAASALICFICWMLNAAPAAADRSALHTPMEASGNAAEPRSVAVLDPVDLTTHLPDPVAGALLRRSLAANPAWDVLPRDSLAVRLRDLGMDPDVPCLEFQCAFDAGNALQTEFVLFGTSTDLPELNAYSLELAHIPTAQVVGSRVGQAPRSLDRHGRPQSAGSEALGNSLMVALASLEPAALDLRKRPSRGLLGVLDGGKSGPRAQVILYRALAHAYAARNYDILGPAELDALSAALELDPAGQRRPEGSGSPAEGTALPSPSPKGVGGAGGSGSAAGHAASAQEDAVALESARRMGLRYLLHSGFRAEGGAYAMDLNLYDVAEGRRLRSWPTRSTRDFTSLLGLEDRFLTALGEAEPLPHSAPRRHPWRAFFKGTSIGLAAVGAGALGYMAWQSHAEAERAYDDFKTARTPQEAEMARHRVVDQDGRTRNLGILGGLTFALGVAIWAF